MIAPPDGEYDTFDASLESWSGYAERVTGLVASLVLADSVDAAIGPLWDIIRREGIVLLDDGTHKGR